MDYLKLSISEIHKAILAGKVSPKELILSALKKAHEDKNNAFEYICDKEALEQVENLNENQKNNQLYGIPFVLKDNFSTKDIPTTGSSNILNGYVPIYSSEVYLRLIEQGAILIGKTTMDELAMGGTGTTGHKGVTYNPWDKTNSRLVGGSSCGSAAASSAGIVPFAIGSDTGDSVRKPASYAGLVGFKPTWGRISRYGMFPFATSLDHVAFFTRNVEDSAIILKVLAGRDDKDSTSSFKPVDDYCSQLNANLKGKKIALIKGINDSINDKLILDSFNNVIELAKQEGATVDLVEIDNKLLKAIYPTYIVISCAEATSNNANLDGIKFGPRAEGESYEQIVFNNRTNGFSELIKRRFVIGSYSLLKENQNDLFLRAQRCRHLIVDTINNVLDKYDAILTPAAPSVAPLISSVSSDKLSNEYLIADNHLAIANFGGLPSITIPCGFENGLPFGLNLTGKAFEETKLYSIAKRFEDITGLANIVAKEDK